MGSITNTSVTKINRRSIVWMIWGIASIFYGYQYILRVMPNVIMPEILQQFNIDATVFGQFSGVYYLGYSLMHLPIGILLDRFGPKKVMPICILLTGVGMLPLIMSDFWIYPILGRALIGMGSSAAILGTFKIIRLTFKEEQFTRMLSFSVMIGLVGAIYGGGPLNYLCSHFGYQAVIYVLILIALGLSFLTYIIVPNVESEHQTGIWADIKEVLLSPKVLGICFLAGLMVGPLEGFADVWGGAFLKQVYGYDSEVAASLPSAIFLGMCFGAPVLSYIAEKSKNYIATIMGAGIIMALGFFILLSGKMSFSMMSTLFIVIGVCCAYQIIAIYKASTYVKEHVVGLTTALANMIIMIFGYFFHSLIGWIINTSGGTQNVESFLYGIAVIPITLSIAVLGFFIFKRSLAYSHCSQPATSDR